MGDVFQKHDEKRGQRSYKVRLEMGWARAERETKQRGSRSNLEDVRATARGKEKQRDVSAWAMESG